MTLPMLSAPHSLVDAWEVLVLFLIPVGGGIPAGVILAQKRGLVWPLMMILYFISDVILACVLEPLLKLLITAGRNKAWVTRLAEGFKVAVKRSTAHYGTSTGPLALILIAFGVDPMTGRAAAAAAGHGFVTGWLIAIAGDMIFFTLLMVSTLWLNSVLGDGTLTTMIILAVMIVLPVLVRRVRERMNRKGADSRESAP